MKIVNILGGLGNQMFQYAFAVALKAEFSNEEVKINTHYFNGYPLHNGYELDDIFDIQLPYASLKDLLSHAWPISHYRFWQIANHMLPRRKGMVYDTDFDNKAFSYDKIRDKRYFDGYWQSASFFDKHMKEVKKAFKFPLITDSKNLKTIDWISKGRTAFIHVRRGDYINHPLLGGICTGDYYRKGIQYLKNNGFNQFAVFSNDIGWCKSNLTDYLDTTNTLYIDWNKSKESFRDMNIMSVCSGALIANSSFSWWGAWLGEMEMVLCPEKWTNQPDLLTNIYPYNWIKVHS